MPLVVTVLGIQYPAIRRVEQQRRTGRGVEPRSRRPPKAVCESRDLATKATANGFVLIGTRPGNVTGDV